LAAAGGTVLADLSGENLRAALRGGLHLVKISHEAFLKDGWAKSDDLPALRAGLRSLYAAGAANVLLSRAERPSLALLDGAEFEIHQPRLIAADHRGAGDSMTGAVAAGVARGMDLPEAVRLGAAAGALNATRRGLASGDRGQIEDLTGHVRLVPLAAGPEGHR
jgi:1-phosphofructokinase